MEIKQKTFKERLDTALTCIVEICVDESKCIIDSKDAVEQIRKQLDIMNEDEYDKDFPPFWKIATDIDVGTKIETAWVIQRENGEFFKEYNEFYIQFTDIIDCEKYDVKPIGVLNFLERHKCEFPDELKNLKIMEIEIKMVD